MSPVLLIVFVVFAALGHGYLWVDIVNRIHAWAGPRKIVDGVTMACMAAFVLLPLFVLAGWTEIDLANFSFSRVQGSLLRYYLLFCALWGAAKLLIAWAFALTTNNKKTLRNWRQEKLHLDAPLSSDDLVGRFPKLLGSVPFNQVFALTVDRKQLAIPELPPKLAGLRIAHISDLHITGRIGPRWYEQVAEQVNQLEPDVIAITGDIVEKEHCWPWLADSLGKLRATHGVYFIMGNHDYYIDTDRTKQLLEDQGLIHVTARCVEANWNGVSVIVAGNERPWGPGVDQLATSESAEPPFRLLLMHTPDQFAWAQQQRGDLALAGHTHGGQLRFPVLGPIACPSRFGTRYACGVFRRGKTVMHVTRGISGKTPLRWNCPPEIALLELVAE